MRNGTLSERIFLHTLKKDGVSHVDAKLTPIRRAELPWTQR